MEVLEFVFRLLLSSPAALEHLLDMGGTAVFVPLLRNANENVRT